MGYVNKILSLEDMASAQVAINLCQDNGFKEVALRLEKPTYGAFIPYESSDFVSDPEILSVWAKMEKDSRSLDAFIRSYSPSNEEKLKQWNAAVDEQCESLTERIPPFLRQWVRPWINRIAWEYLSYSRRLEVIFGVSRYFLMNFFTRGDWKEAGRLDEKKLARRLLEDERLTVLQRYRIACVHCLHAHIPQLWKRLTQEEKWSIIGDAETRANYHGLVLLWSYQTDEEREEKLTEDCLWTYATQQATIYGNRVALMTCWKRLKEHIRKQEIIDLALHSLRQWQGVHLYLHYKETLVSNQGLASNNQQSADHLKNFNLPAYSELVRFFLSEMKEEQQLTFFKQALESSNSDRVLECFLEWPHQDDFLPTINRLWGIIPKYNYGQCLLALAKKYSSDEKENRYFDYRSLLKTLWEETPEEYRQYVFSNKRVDYYRVRNEGKALLCRLLERSPFQEKDETLFKRVFCDQPQEERRAMMRSEYGKNICSLLTQKEKWSFLNWLLEECLPEGEIPCFKKQFIKSDCGVKLCLEKLKENREKWVEDLIDWSLVLDSEKTQCKFALLTRGCDSSDACESLLRRGEFAKVERRINFCLSSDQTKERFKARLAQSSCTALLRDWARGASLEDCVWEQMDTILAWSADAEEKIRDLKKDILSDTGISVHYDLVFDRTCVRRRWEKIERFYEWFGLSPEEIKNLKKDTIFTPGVIEDIHDVIGEFPEYTNKLEASLRWCLIDEEMVIDLKKKVEEEWFKQVLDEAEKEEKERLDYFMSELLCSFRKEEVQNKTSLEGVFLKDKGGKRSSVAVEDESSSPRKRCK